MFILDEPYVSDYLIETINKNGYNALLTPITVNKIRNLKEKYIFENKVYTNSENSIDKIEDKELLKKISVFKDKFKTRELFKKIYPDFFYKKVSKNELNNVDYKILPYPVIIKPVVGFLSIGVYVVQKEDEYFDIIQKINADIEKSKNLFPKSVLKFDDFIIEKVIRGEEIALDVYYNSKQEPVILNIYKHPFVSSDDVSDRLYYTSFDIIQEYSKILLPMLYKTGKEASLSDFPMHIELRIENGVPIPIEINPMRFAGWCLCDLARYAHKVNVYEAYMNDLKPSFNPSDKSFFAFVLAEVPSDIKKDDIIYFDINRFIEDMNVEILETRIYDFKLKPLFASFFVKAESEDNLLSVLKLNTKDYVNTRRDL